MVGSPFVRFVMLNIILLESSHRTGNVFSRHFR